MTRSWQRLLLEALERSEVIGVSATARAFLGHEPTRSELTAVCRAARTLASRGEADSLRVPSPTGRTSMLVLTRPGVEVDELGAYVAATRGVSVRQTELPARLLFAEIERALEVAAALARTVNLLNVDPSTAADLAGAMGRPLEDLNRLRRLLEARVRRQAQS